MGFSSLPKLAFALLTGAFFTVNANAQLLLNPASQPRFVNPLPTPSVIDATNGFTEQQPLKMEIKQFEKDLGLINPTTGQPFGNISKVWGYKQVGSNLDPEYPGPTIVAKSGVPVNVFWYNNLVDGNGQPLPHLLTIDKSIHTAFNHTPEPIGVPVVTHLHGGHSESASDGLPDAWFTPGFAHKGQGFVKGEVQPYHYANDQEAATIWYHDHALGITRLNVYAGLAGFYLLTDDVEKNLQDCHKLPAAPYDLGLAIQDRLFTSTGQLFYPTAPVVNPNQPNETFEGILPEMFGNIILVNGKAWPVLEVEPRQYRFRLLNGSDSRFYNLFFSENLKFRQIGSDLGLLPNPVSHDQLLLANGERKDVIIDFSNPALWGKTIIMRNNAKTPYPKGSTPNPQNEGQIMAFKVTKPLNTTDPIPNTNPQAYNTYPLTPVPGTLRPALPPRPAVANTRKLILFEGEDNFGRLKAQLGTFSGGAFNYLDAITENPAMNSTEIWEIYNQTEDAHPIHLHLVNFQVLNTQKFKPIYASAADAAIGKLAGAQLIGQPKLPEMGQRGLKDTYPIEPGEVARLIATFDREGLYVWHCHILSHEDHEMMRPYYVGNLAPRVATATNSASQNNSAPYSLFPNPLTNSVNLKLELPENTLVGARLLDLQGKLVKVLPAAAFKAGNHQLSLDASELSNGLYVCEVQLAGKTYRERLVVAK